MHRVGAIAQLLLPVARMAAPQRIQCHALVGDVVQRDAQHTGGHACGQAHAGEHVAGVHAGHRCGMVGAGDEQ